MRVNTFGRPALAVLSALAALAAPAAPIPVRGATWQWCFKDPGLDFCLRTADAMASLGYNAVMPEFGPVLQSRHYQSPRATFWISTSSMEASLLGETSSISIRTYRGYKLDRVGIRRVSGGG